MRKKISGKRESENRRNVRLSYQRKRSISNISSESVDRRNARLTNQRKRSASNLSSESVDRRNARLTNQRKRSASNLSSESVDRRNARLTNQRKRSASNRLSKRALRKTARVGHRQQRSETTHSIDERQQMVEQHQIVNIPHQQRALEEEQQILRDQYNWPAAIPTQLKEYCLQDFCDRTSMSALRQSTCIICNIRTSATAMKELNLRNIPNPERLSCHVDLINIIPTTTDTAQSENLNCAITFVNVYAFLST